MESESDDDDAHVVKVQGQAMSYHDVTPDMVQQMTNGEKEEYIRIGQEMYQNMYD